MDEYGSDLSVRLLNSLDDGQASIDGIYRILDDLGAVPVARYVTAGVSGCRTSYRLPDGRLIYFKQIRRVRLPDTCAACRFNNDTDCQEGYYGVHLYRERGGGYLVGVCIQRMDLCMPIGQFASSPLREEIVRLRDSEYAQLTDAAHAALPPGDEWVPTEYESKVLDVDLEETAQLILSVGGQRLGQAFMRRYVYDIVSGDQSRWIRLRDTGSEVTLSVKEIASDAIDGTDEVEVAVGDLASTNQLLGRLGFSPKSYQETRRTSFVLEGARIEIDEWPLIRPYVEIEADSRDEVTRVAGLLGFDEAQLVGENTIKIYARYGMDP